MYVIWTKNGIDSMEEKIKDTTKSHCNRYILQVGRQDKILQCPEIPLPQWKNKIQTLIEWMGIIKILEEVTAYIMAEIICFVTR